MALHWNVKNVKDAYREITKEEFESAERKIVMMQPHRYYDEEADKYFEMHVELNMLIFVCGMFTGIPNITEDNYKRLSKRIEYLEKLNGAYLYDVNPSTNKRTPHFMDEEMVKRFIGLETNGSKMTKSQFISQATNSWEL